MLVNGTVTIDVTLPDGGYVVIHGGRYVFDEIPDPIGRTAYLEPGTHTVSVPLESGTFPPNSTGRLAAVVHRDSGEDRDFTRYEGNTSSDPPYKSTGEPIDDAATITAPSTSTSTATPNATATSPADSGSESLGTVEFIGIALGALLVLAAIGVLVTGRRKP